MSWCRELVTNRIQHKALRASLLRVLLKKGGENSIFYMETSKPPFQLLLVPNQLQFIPCVLPALGDLWKTLDTKENSFDFA